MTTRFVITGIASAVRMASNNQFGVSGFRCPSLNPNSSHSRVLKKICTRPNRCISRFGDRGRDECGILLSLLSGRDLGC